MHVGSQNSNADNFLDAERLQTS